MKLKPLTGQVLVEILPNETRSVCGIEIPHHTPSPEENQEAARRPTMPPALTGVVKAIGQWPKTRSGLARMPEYGIGARVIVGPNAGLDMAGRPGERLKMLHQSQILAVLTDPPFKITDWASGPGPEIGMY